MVNRGGKVFARKQQVGRKADESKKVKAAKFNPMVFATEMDCEAYFKTLKPDYKSLEETEREAIGLYSGEGYHHINKLLRHDKFDPDTYARDELGFITKEDVINTAIEPLKKAITKTKTKDDLILYRGFDSHVVKNISVGDTVEDKGFMSTSISENVAFYFGSHIAEIRCPKGTNYVPVFGENDAENEFLLHGYDLKLIEKKDNGSKGVKLIMEIVKKEEEPKYKQKKIKLTIKKDQELNKVKNK